MKKLLVAQLILFLVMLHISCRDENQSLPAVVNNAESSVRIKVAVKVSIGEILYENLDAQLSVKGYDQNNACTWQQEYDFTGPLDILTIKNGHHHYSIKLVDKWGVQDIQSNIRGKDVWDGRADGPLPVTYVVGGSKAGKKLLTYITSHEQDGPTGIVGELESKVSFTYTPEGHVESIRRQYFNLEKKEFEEGETQTFTYVGNRVSKILTTRDGKPARQYDYEYGLAQIITETNYDAGVVTTQTTERNGGTRLGGDSVTVNYNFSNGNSLLYRLGFSFENIVSDRTLNAGQLCNAGIYTYDKNINPFQQLGYLDFNFENWSVNNKVIEDVDFTGCAFPTLIPLFHTYTYDLDGYPVRKITTYKSGSGQTKPYHSKVNYFYE